MSSWPTVRRRGVARRLGLSVVVLVRVRVVAMGVSNLLVVDAGFRRPAPRSFLNHRGPPARRLGRRARGGTRGNDHRKERDMATRNGSAEWHGDLQGGSGQITVGNGVHTGPYSFKSRFEDGEGTNPEELISAALAGCFSMALGNILAEAGHTAESISTSARAQLRPVDGVPTIT